MFLALGDVARHGQQRGLALPEDPAERGLKQHLAAIGAYQAPIDIGVSLVHYLFEHGQRQRGRIAAVRLPWQGQIGHGPSQDSGTRPAEHLRQGLVAIDKGFPLDDCHAVVDGANELPVVFPGFAQRARSLDQLGGVDRADDVVGNASPLVAKDGVVHPDVDGFAVLVSPPGGAGPAVLGAGTGEEFAKPMAFLADENSTHQVGAEDFFGRISAQCQGGLVDADDLSVAVGDQLWRAGLERNRGDALLFAQPVGLGDVMEHQHHALHRAIGIADRCGGIGDLPELPGAGFDGGMIGQLDHGLGLQHLEHGIGQGLQVGVVEWSEDFVDAVPPSRVPRPAG